MALGSAFSIRENVLFYRGDPVTPDSIENARKLVDAHVVPRIDEHYALRSVLFCIASERTEFERAVEFTRLLHTRTIEEMLDPFCQVETAKAAGLPHSNKHPWETDAEDDAQASFIPRDKKEKSPSATDGRENRFSYISTYLKKNGIESTARKLITQPYETRRELDREVKWVAAKTASFWHLTLGGKEFLTMDVHCYRQLAGIMDIDRKYTDGEVRPDGRQIPAQPPMRQYEQIEAKAKELLERFAFLHTNGTLDGALVTGLLWNVGAMEYRGCHPDQNTLFAQELAFRSPYEAPQFPLTINWSRHICTQ